MSWRWTFQRAPIRSRSRPVIGLQVPDGRVHGLAPPQPGTLRDRQRLAFAPVDELHGRDLGIDAAVARVHDGGGRLHADVLQQRGRLIELRGQRVAVILVAGEGAAELVRLWSPR